MIMSKKQFPLWLRYLLFNLASVMLLLWKGQFRSDPASIIAIIFAFALMNLAAWASSRHYREWK